MNLRLTPTPADSFNQPKSDKKAKVKYFANNQDFSRFFTPKLCSCVDQMAGKLPESSQIWIYPDATLKANKLPTGIAYLSTPEETILFPQLLRDPGCGFLTFKLDLPEETPANWQEEAGQLLEELINSHSIPKEPYTLSNEKLKQTLLHGLSALNLPETELLAFMDRAFPVNANLFNPTDEELEKMQSDFLSVTNTVEIRKPYKILKQELLTESGITEKSFIGFIHAGSFIFPRLLLERYFFKIAEYADRNGLATVEEINAGHFGVPYETTLGKEFYAWINAAMNFAVASRYYAYLRIKDTLEKKFNCKITIISDNVHAGVIEKNNSEHESLICSIRGVQSLTNSHTSKPAISLLAGQRETIAALVIAGANSSKYHHFYAHGTGYNIPEQVNHENIFSPEEINHYLQLAESTFYNSATEQENCLAYTANLLISLNYFSQIGLAEPAALLAPFVNIQSNWLKTPDNIKRGT